MVDEYEQTGVVSGARFRGQFLSTILTTNLHVITDQFVGDNFGFSRCLFLSVLFWGQMGILWIQIPNLPLFAFGWLLGTAPIWAPIAGIFIAWKVWIWYAQGSYLFKR